MKNFDLVTYQVEEMTCNEMMDVNGGATIDSFLSRFSQIAETVAIGIVAAAGLITDFVSKFAALVTALKSTK